MYIFKLFMIATYSIRVRMMRIISVMFVLFSLILLEFVFSETAMAQDETGKSNESKAVADVDPERLAAWHVRMAKIPPPDVGCATVAYPVVKWTAVACVVAPDIFLAPKNGPRPLVIGSGNDISAQAPSGFISRGIGSFDSVTGVTSATSTISNSGTPVANAYTLQLNTDFFVSTTCSGSPNTGCRGWEQFAFFNDGTSGSGFIQYWLIRYNAACPAGWTQFSFTGSTDIYCVRNSSAVPIPNQPISNLANMTVTGTAAAGSDSLKISTGANLFTVAGIDAVNAAAGWTIAEFNVFGAGGSSSGASELTFNAGSTVVPRTRIFYGDKLAPNCVAQGFTGETNNLNFGPNPPGSTPPGPAVFFTESSAGGALTNCAAATTIGDTHLHTLGGLFYDFQASGDFILAQSGYDFVVQARQVSGAPTWPDTSVNNSVATQMGSTKVAVCLNPDRRLVINGAVTALTDGNSHLTPDGVTIWRHDNVYSIIAENGNAMRATVNSSWVNADVGLGRWPSVVTGLLADANGKTGQIATRDGAVLTAPFSFEDLYGAYADSWRVPADVSLLSACDDPGSVATIETGAPGGPFYAQDLPPDLYASSRAICVDAGVTNEILLDACTLDVAVLGTKEAADGFVKMTAPTAVGIATTDVPPILGDKDACPRLLVWTLIAIIVVLLIVIILCCLRKKGTRKGGLAS